MSKPKEPSEQKASYSLAPTHSFVRDLRRLDKIANRRILQEIELLKVNPRVGKTLRGQLEGYWSLRVGDFRVIYMIDDLKLIVTLCAVGHRKHVYER